MDYLSVYNKIIEFRATNPPAGYSEKHHILPKSLGGTDHADNLVRLTAREHFVSHRLLAKIYGGPMWIALQLMSCKKTKSAKGVFIPSRTYEIIKSEAAAWKSEQNKGKGNPYYGKKHSAKVRKKMSQAASKKDFSYLKTEEYRSKRAGVGKNISAALKRKYQLREIQRFIDNRFMKSKELRKMQVFYERSERAKKLIAGRDVNGKNNPNYANGAAIAGNKNPMYGRKHKESTKRKIAEVAKRRVKCPNCDKVGNVANMKRWHFGNCKKLKSITTSI